LGYGAFAFALLMTVIVAAGYDIDVTNGKWTLLRPGELIEDRRTPGK